MSAISSIEWTDRTWSPVRGCSRVSDGCANCYAMRQAHRFSGAGKPYEGLTTIRRGKVDWTGTARLVPSALAEPLSWRKPQRVFVNSMSDLFHESLSNEEIAAVFGVMAAASQHTFQVLTKRPGRAREWFTWYAQRTADCNAVGCGLAVVHASQRLGVSSTEFMPDYVPAWPSWPLTNVWIGTSVEDQKTADERIPLLLKCPAALWFVSAEPLLESVNITRYLNWGSICECPSSAKKADRCEGKGPAGWIRCAAGTRAIRWVIAGFESGNGARPGDVEWLNALVRQCASVRGWGKRPARVPLFVKQLGRLPMQQGVRLHIKDRKGGDMQEWPEDLRVREFPKVTNV